MAMKAVTAKWSQGAIGDLLLLQHLSWAPCTVAETCQERVSLESIYIIITNTVSGL